MEVGTRRASSHNSPLFVDWNTNQIELQSSKTTIPEMVSVFEGQLTRTWFYATNSKKHILTLYHDTLTGVRSCSIDFDEVPGSYGNSSVVMDSTGHRIFFEIHNPTHDHGYFEIKRDGWMGFNYSCVVNNIVLTETTHEVSEFQDPIYSSQVVDNTFIPDEFSETQVAWYRVVTKRTTDNVVTSVHRRFKEFADLNSQIKQNFKGHHLRSSIPEFPEKTLKIMADHTDPCFIAERRVKLDRYLQSLLSLPHINDMMCVRAFVGLMEKVKEVSFTFHLPTLGLTLLPTEKIGTPCVIGTIMRNVETNEGGSIVVGDAISKINGVSVADLNFNGVVARIKMLPRPLMIHFIQVLTVSGNNVTNVSLITPTRKDFNGQSTSSYSNGGNYVGTSNVSNGAANNYSNNSPSNNNNNYTAPVSGGTPIYFTDDMDDPLAGTSSNNNNHNNYSPPTQRTNAASQRAATNARAMQANTSAAKSSKSSAYESLLNNDAFGDDDIPATKTTSAKSKKASLLDELVPEGEDIISPSNTSATVKSSRSVEADLWGAPLATEDNAAGDNSSNGFQLPESLMPPSPPAAVYEEPTATVEQQQQQQAPVEEEEQQEVMGEDAPVEEEEEVVVAPGWDI